jgi:hypothetical protein
VGLISASRVARSRNGSASGTRASKGARLPHHRWMGSDLPLPSRFAAREGTRVSAKSRAAIGLQPFVSTASRRRLPDVRRRGPTAQAAPTKTASTAAPSQEARLALAKAGERDQRFAVVSAGRVVSQKSETSSYAGLFSDGRRSGFRSRSRSRVCGEESLGDQNGFAETKVTAGRFGNDRSVRGLVELKYGRKTTPPCSRSIRRSKSGP